VTVQGVCTNFTFEQLRVNQEEIVREIKDNLGTNILKSIYVEFK
jgi:hypothetical protein